MSTPENTAAVLGTSWPEVFRALTLGEDLSDDVAAWAMGEMMAGDATEGLFIWTAGLALIIGFMVWLTSRSS